MKVYSNLKKDSWSLSVHISHSQGHQRHPISQ